MTLDYIFKKATGKTTDEWSQDGKLQYFDRYANPREDSGAGVLVANWNQFPRPGDQEFNWGKGRKFQDILEKLGYQLEWSDQTERCDHCYGVIRTGMDYYGDSAHAVILGDDTVCEDCIRKDFADEYLEGLENKPRAAVNIRGIDPAKHGYVEVESNFENGFHPGQNDSPVEIFKRLRDRHERLLFVIDSVGQFDVKFSIWEKAEGEDEG